MLIAYILAALAAICAYLYLGLTLAANMVMDTIPYYLFWVAYAIFGLSIGTVLFLGKAWQILQAKRGPVGPRGYRGDSGEQGQAGECFTEQYVIAIKKATLSAIADTLIEEGIIQEHKQVYDPDRLRLVNRYLDMRFQRQMDSAQLYSLMDSGIKTSGEVATYISGLWSEWTHGLITFSNGKDNDDVRRLFTEPTTTPAINTHLDSYITNEAARSDVWNWGHPPVIRRAQVRVRPYKRDYEDRASSTITASKPTERRHSGAPLKFHIVEYSDRDLSAMQPEPLWTSKGYPDADPLDTTPGKSDSKSNVLNAIVAKAGAGILGTVRRPALYLPRTWLDPVTKERYYPLGPVLVETEPQLMTAAVRRCLLVSGDIIIPNKVSTEPVWRDTTGRTNQGAFYHLDTDQPGYSMLTTLWPTSGRQTAKTVRRQLGGMDPQTGILLQPDNWRGPVAVPTSFLIDSQSQVNDNLDMWIYQPPPLPRKGAARTKYLLKYAAPSTEHVAIFTNRDTNASGGIAQAMHLPITVSSGSNKSKNINSSSSGFIGKQFQDWVLKMGLPGQHDLGKEPPHPLVTNEQTDNLGLAWYGEPQRDSKYSVFAFLGIVPEGQIRHPASGRVFRFRHYGGPEPEIYNMLVTMPTMRYVRKQDTKAYLVATATTDATPIQFLSMDKSAEDPTIVQWRIKAVDMVSKRIGPLDVSRYRDSGDTQQMVVMESVARPGHVIAIKSRANLKVNRWSRGTTANNEELANRRPVGINLDGVYLEWKLLANVKRAGDMSIFILEPAA